MTDDCDMVSEGYGELSLCAVEKIVSCLCYSLNPHSTVLDIGSGSGKVILCLQALLPFALRKALGVEIVPHRYEAGVAVQKKFESELQGHVTFENKNIFKSDEAKSTSWSHIIMFDKVFPHETLSKFSQFFNDGTYLVSTHHKNFWNRILEQDDSQCRVKNLTSMQISRHAMFTQGLTLHIHKVQKGN